MILGFMDISIPNVALLFPLVFSLILYWILVYLIPQTQTFEQNEVLDLEEKMTITNYRTPAFWVSIFFISTFILSVFGLSFFAGLLVSLASSISIFLIPILILGYGFYNIVMMIRNREPRDYKFWIGYVGISYFTSFVFLWLAALIIF